MSMIDQFQKLDALIVEHTQPPVTGVLRGQLALTREQVEAYQAASDKQDQTLAAQVEAMATLQSEKQALIAKYEQPDKVGVTLKNGQTIFYSANSYVLLPNKISAAIIEFRMVDKARGTYREVAHAKWSDVSEVHNPTTTVDDSKLHELQKPGTIARVNVNLGPPIPRVF